MKPLPKRGAGERRGLGGCSAAAPPSVWKHCLRVRGQYRLFRLQSFVFCKHKRWSFKCEGGKSTAVTKFCWRVNDPEKYFKVQFSPCIHQLVNVKSTFFLMSFYFKINVLSKTKWDDGDLICIYYIKVCAVFKVK